MAKTDTVSKSAKRKQPCGGSRKGVPNKATKALKDMILGALSDAGGQTYLAQQAKENPGPFLSLIGKVLPTTITGPNDGPITFQHVLGSLPDPDGAD